MNIQGFNERMQGRDYSKQYIDKQPLNADKVYRVNIFSKDRIAGTVRDGIFQIDLPETIPDVNKYHIAVEEFILAVDPGTGNILNRTYVVETSMTNPNTYSTSSKTSSRVLFTCVGSSSTGFPRYYSKLITSRTVGVPVTDLSAFRNSQMQITFKRADDALHTTDSFPDTGVWQMSLVIYPFSP
jgi:hypothetical protein